MTGSKHRLRALALTSLITLTACSGGAGAESTAPADNRTVPQAVAATPEPTTVITMYGDGPSYSSLQALSKASSDVVRVQVLEEQSGMDYPSFDSHDPKVNPYEGTNHTPSPSEVANMGVPATYFRVRVIESFAGALAVGDELVIIQPGGPADGVRYEVPDLPPLTSQQMLFLNSSAKGLYHTVGTGQGRLEPDGRGGYRSARWPQLAVDSRTVDHLDSLVG